MKDNFLVIHDLVREELYKEALSLLYNERTNRIYEEYKYDENHAWYLIGDIYYKLERFQNAVNAFKKSIMNKADDISAMLALGNSYMELGLPDKAEYILRSALKLSSDNEELTYNLGNSLFDQRKYKEAINMYKKISRDDIELFEFAQKNIKKARGQL